MKIAHILTAGLMVAGLGTTTSASAQSYRGYDNGHHERYQNDDRRGDYRHDDRRDYRNDARNYRDDRRDYRDEGRYNGHDRGNHYGWRNHNRVQCRIVWRHGDRYRICR